MFCPNLNFLLILISSSQKASFKISRATALFDTALISEFNAPFFQVNAPQGNNTESEFATSRLEEDELSNLENNNKKNKKNNKNETNNRNNNNNNNNNNSNNNHNMNGNDITHRDAINDVTGNNDVIRSDNDYLKIDGNSTCTPGSGKNGGSNGGNRRHISSLAANSYNFLRHLKLCKMLFIIAFVYFLSFLPSFVYGFLVTFGVLKFNIYIYKGMSNNWYQVFMF